MKLLIKLFAAEVQMAERLASSPFRSKTGRNQPSNSQFIFGPSSWLRGLIRPEPGRALAYVDWSQQEFGIAAALSGDRGMMDAYASGDLYLMFAKQAEAVPPDATKQSHPVERERFKVCALAVQYGMGEQSLATALDQPPIVGRELLGGFVADYIEKRARRIEPGTMQVWLEGHQMGWRGPLAPALA